MRRSRLRRQKPVMTENEANQRAVEQLDKVSEKLESRWKPRDEE